MILAAHGRLTGVPVLVKPSFNVHEEPIVNAPAECLQALIADAASCVRVRSPLALSGYRRVHCTCLLLTQSGHPRASLLRPNLRVGLCDAQLYSSTMLCEER